MSRKGSEKQMWHVHLIYPNFPMTKIRHFSFPNDGFFHSVIEKARLFVVYYYYNEITIPKMDKYDLRKDICNGKIQKKQN